MKYLSREEKKKFNLQRKLLRFENKMWPDHLIEVEKKRWPEGIEAMTLKPEAVWRSKTMLVQIFLERADPPLRRMSICRSEVNEFGDFKDNLTWDEINRAKIECGFGHLDAVEIYPRVQDVVFVANMRHLWIVDGLIPFAWRSRKAGSDENQQGTHALGDADRDRDNRGPVDAVSDGGIQTPESMVRVAEVPFAEPIPVTPETT